MFYCIFEAFLTLALHYLFSLTQNQTKKKNNDLVKLKRLDCTDILVFHTLCSFIPTLYLNTRLHTHGSVKRA